MSDAPPDPVTQAQRQALLYAADLSRVYRRLRDEEARLARVRDRLHDLSSTCLAIAAAPSAELAAEVVARAYGKWLGSRDVLLFAARRGRLRLAGATREVSGRTSLSRPEVSAVSAEPRAVTGAPWSELGLDGPLVAQGLPGRVNQLAGLIVARADVPQGDHALDLFARFAGAMLESHLVEDARGDTRSVGQVTKDTTDAPCAPLRGDGAAMRRVKDLVLRVAPVSSPVLVTGETGTGKELVARAIHDASPRRKGPFVAVNCGALPENLVESEVFGHEAGAFSGAMRRHRGKVELAQGGTLFLDELGELPRPAQVKLLRFLQDGRYTPVGGEEERVADVRVVAATNRDLATAVASGAFREDLLYRLNVFTILLPPLRARERDVVDLARSFAVELAQRFGRTVPSFSPEVERRLLAYGWPGNVRELRNVIERAVVLSPDGALDEALLPGGPPLPASDAPSGDGHVPTALVAAEVDPAVDVLFVGEDLRPFSEAKEAFVARFEKRYCEALLAKSGGNIAKAARLAGIDKKHLRRKLVGYGLLPDRKQGHGDEAGEP